MVETAFGNNAMKKTDLYKWYNKFEHGIGLLLMNRGQAVPHPSKKRKLKQSKSCSTLIFG